MRTWRDVWTEEDLKDEMEEDDEIRSYCKKCLERGYEILMGPKILMPGEKRQADYEEWKMCPKCYDVIPIYEIEPEPEVQNVVETIDSPFESKFEVVGVPKRNTKAGKHASAKKRRNKIKMDEDPEIDALLKIYGDRMKVIK